jgi:hypothetical protein
LFGFDRSVSEPAVYTKGQGSKQLIIGVYVDDLMITGTCNSDIKKFKMEMAKVSSMSDLGLLHYSLGIEVIQGEKGVSLSQAAYASKIVEKCGLSECNAHLAPLENRLKLSVQNEEKVMDRTLYRSLVGCLKYLVNTRPDLGYAVGYVNRFLDEPKEDHMAAVKNIVRYVARTQNWRLWFSKHEKKEAALTVFSDSDYAGDVDKRKSTMDVICFLSRSTIAWQSMKQKIVAQSSCEVEYIAAANTTCQVLWLSRVLAEIQGIVPAIPLLKIDNKSAISLIKNPVFSGQSKHIEAKYPVVRESASRGLIEVEFIGTKDLLDDILTKALGRLTFL